MIFTGNHSGGLERRGSGPCNRVYAHGLSRDQIITAFTPNTIVVLVGKTIQRKRKAANGQSRLRKQTPSSNFPGHLLTPSRKYDTQQEFCGKWVVFATKILREVLGLGANDLNYDLKIICMRMMQMDLPAGHCRRLMSFVSASTHAFIPSKA